ncbi:MAG: chorismate synthase, partial [bacterium]|nr:chorismate synthase [bacterium]
CPPGLTILKEDIQIELDRRKPGQSHITTQRKEEDLIEIMSGVFENKTTGTPILLIAKNKDAKSEDYNKLKESYRPSHADYTYEKKYGIRDPHGGGRGSGRTTLSLVAAGAVAKKYLKEKLGIEFSAYTEQVENIKTDVDFTIVTKDQIESNIVRCPDQKIAKEMIELIEIIGNEGDSVGGIIKGIIRNVPVGLGEPVFDKLSADLGKAMLSINAVKGFDIGSGFSCTSLKGSQHNDEFYLDNNQKIRTKTNFSGGTQGGISNGETIYFRVAFKPVSTIRKLQKTVNIKNEEVTIEASGRHDPCVLPRAVPIVEAMAALVIMDHYLRNKAQNS